MNKLQWLSFLAFGLVLIAAQPTQAPDPVKVTVVSMLATTKNENVDPKLSCVARELKKSHPELKGLQIARISCKSVPVGGTETFTLVEDQIAEVHIQEGANKNAQVRIEAKLPKLGPVVYTSKCGKFLPIVPDYQTKGGDQLIIAIMCRPCDDH